MPRPQQLLTPGPTAVPPEVLKRARASRCSTTARPTSPRCSRSRRSGSAPSSARSARCSSSPPPAPARSSPRSSTCSRRASASSPSRRASSASAGRRWRARSAATSSRSRTPGARRRARRPARGALAESGAQTVFLVHSETSTGVVCDLEPLLAVCARGGRAVDRRRRLESRRRAARDGRLGRRRRRDGLAEGAHDAARPRVRGRLRTGLGAKRDGDAAALLLGLGAATARPGEGLDAVHAGDVDSSSRSPRRSGSSSRTGSRRRSPDTERSAARAAPGSRRSGSSSTRRTTTAPRC